MATGFLEQFFIQYLTNAKQAARDTRDFNKANDELTDGTKKLTEEERKRNRELEQQAALMTDLVAKVTTAAAAWVGLRAVQGGIVKATDFNNTLYLQNRLLGQSSQEVAALGAMMQKFGGDAGGFNSWLSQTTMEFNALGRQLPPVAEMFSKINQQLQGLTQAEKNFHLQRLGITDPAMVLMLSQTTEEFQKQYAAKVKLNEVSAESTRVANEWTAAWGGVKDAMNSVFTQIQTQILPVLTPMASGIADLIANNKGWAEAIVFVGTALTTLAGFLVTKGLITAMLALGGAVMSISWPFLALAAAIAAVVAGYQLLAGTDKNVANPNFSGGGGSSGGSGKISKSNFGSAKSAMDFWKSQGYTHEQAAGWAANMIAESNGNPNARGDGGKAVGLFQWHPDRQRKILEGTGIDVRTASFEDQLRAAAWEAEQRGDAARVRQQKSADAAASTISRYYERPANGDYQAIMRGKAALDIANNSSLSSGGSVVNGGSRTVNMNVGGINVNEAASPQATGQEINNVLQKQFSDTIGSLDDGMAY